jgi:hypothetical protein
VRRGAARWCASRNVDSVVNTYNTESRGRRHGASRQHQQAAHDCRWNVSSPEASAAWESSRRAFTIAVPRARRGRGGLAVSTGGAVLCRGGLRFFCVEGGAQGGASALSCYMWCGMMCCADSGRGRGGVECREAVRRPQAEERHVLVLVVVPLRVPLTMRRRPRPSARRRNQAQPHTAVQATCAPQRSRLMPPPSRGSTAARCVFLDFRPCESASHAER